MSAGNLIGSVFNTLLFGGLYTVFSYIIEKLFRAFNHTIAILPTFQDAVNGFSIMQQFWIAIFILIFIVIWVNYLLNENSQASGGV
jgi:type II secretory pathway component PulF